MWKMVGSTWMRLGTGSSTMYRKVGEWKSWIRGITSLDEKEQQIGSHERLHDTG